MIFLGKRPDLKGKLYHKTPPVLSSSSKQSRQGIISNSMIPNEMKSIQYSNTLEGLLPSEAYLLIQNRNGK